MEEVKYMPYVTIKKYDGTNAEEIDEFVGLPFDIVNDELVYDSAGYISVESGSVITNTGIIFENVEKFLKHYTASK